MNKLPPGFLTDRQRLVRAGKTGFQVPRPVVVHDKTRLAQVGRRPEEVRPITNFSQKTHFVLNVEDHVRHNVAELIVYEQCIKKTLAYTGRDGYSKSSDQNLAVRRSNVTTWNPGEVLAPVIAPLLHFPPNLWDEFVDGTGPQNSAFLSEHPVTTDLKSAMRDEVEKLLFLLYDKYQGYPKNHDEYVDMKLSFGPVQAIAALSNRNKSFVGSANMSGFVLGNRLIVIVADVKSAHSLAAHATHKIDHYRSPRLAMFGFTYQFYIWSIGLKNYDWYKSRKKIVDIQGRKKDWFGINPTLLP